MNVSQVYTYFFIKLKCFYVNIIITPPKLLYKVTSFQNGINN